jgi:hypothetical protein
MLGDSSSTSASHVEGLSLAIASHSGGIHTIGKPIHVRCKDKFFYRTCKGSHLTRLCPATARILLAWFSVEGPSGSESSLVSPHSIPSFIDTIVMPMKSSDDTPLPLGVDASIDLVVSHPAQPMVVSMQSSTNTTPIFRSDVSLDLFSSHPIQPMVEEVVAPMQFYVDPIFLVLVLYLLYYVIRIYDIAPSKQERVLLSPSTLPSSLGKVPFDWDGLVGYSIHLPMSFQVRDIIRYIMETITYPSTLSSSTLRALGFPKLVSAICNILIFHKNPAREPWPPLRLAA